MDFSDDDVSASSGSEDHEAGSPLSGGSEDEEFADDDLGAFGSEEGGQGDAGVAAAVAAAAVAGGGGAGANKVSSSARAITDALISGEMSTQTALLQMEVSEREGRAR